MVDDQQSNSVSNKKLLEELGTIIDNEKFVIIDLSVHKTVKAIKGSLKCGPKGENISYKLERKNPTRLEKYGFYAGEFLTHSIGRYRIDISNFNVPIKNSPLFVNVFNSKLVEIMKKPDELLIGSDNLIEGILKQQLVDKHN